MTEIDHICEIYIDLSVNLAVRNMKLNVIIKDLR